MMKHIRLLVLVLLFTVGTASAVPTVIDNRAEYSQSLNSIACVIMGWYGSLISGDESVAFSEKKYTRQWKAYRQQYPEKINHIIITDTELLKTQEGNYQFNVEAKITYDKNNKKHTRALKETFIFKSDISSNGVVIKSIKSNKNKPTEALKTTGYDREHYKVREFTYAWLSYLDGLDSFNTAMDTESWLDAATYSLEIGAKKYEGSVSQMFSRRKQTLARGGHLLRSLEVKKTTGLKDAFVLDLVLEWKGVNVNGHPVIARIHQEIDIRIAQDGTWNVISIKERHLLPLIGPWMGLLC